MFKKKISDDESYENNVGRQKITKNEISNEITSVMKMFGHLLMFVYRRTSWKIVVRRSISVQNVSTKRFQCETKLNEINETRQKRRDDDLFVKKNFFSLEKFELVVIYRQRQTDEMNQDFE